jgi:hypothetical protein
MAAICEAANRVLVMPGLVPGIHVFLGRTNQDVDGKPGHGRNSRHCEERSDEAIQLSLRKEAGLLR